MNETPEPELKSTPSLDEAASSPSQETTSSTSEKPQQLDTYVGDELTLKQKRFCELFASPDKDFFGNGTQAYIEAYNPDSSKPNWYKSAAASASRLLNNVKICDYINGLLETGGLNDEFVDKQLLYLITQHEDKTAKNMAIREYNKLKGRIVEKIDHTSKGEQIVGFKFIAPEPPKDSPITE